MLSKILKQERTKKGLSQMAFAKLFGVSQQTIGSWETNRTSPDLESLSKLANFFNVSIDYLLGLTDIPETIDTYIAKQSNKQPVENQYNADEQELIQLYRELPPEGKITIKSLAKTQHDLYVKPKSDEKAI
jgi:transcriptional regulator with XRE-family HTH domain